MQKKEKQVNFSTRDIYLAATLITIHFYMCEIDYQIEDGRPVGYFQFEETKELKEAERKFWQGNLSVEPRQFITNMRALKAQINNAYKSPHSEFSNKV